jgi:ribosomal protein L34E
MENMRIYTAVKECPENAKRAIQAGKLKGKTDINPMWRIKKLTEVFGPCGEGWVTEHTQYWTTPGAEGEVVAWCSLELRYKDGESWSLPVLGIGGAMLIDTQKGKLVTNDDAYKMAYTDAISVACKALGMAADVYWDNDRTKYDRPAPAPATAIPCERCGHDIRAMRSGGKVYTSVEIARNARKAYGAALCWDCMKAMKAEKGREEAPDENAD